MDRGDALEQVRDLQVRLEQAQQALEGAGVSTLPGFSGLAIDYGRFRLKLWWKGTAPAPVMKQVADLHEAKRIEIEISEARHSAEELDVLIEQVKSHPGFDQSGISALVRPPEGDALYVGYRGDVEAVRGFGPLGSTDIEVTYAVDASPL